MAPQKREQSAPVKGVSVQRILSFQLFQAVHLLETLLPGRKALGQTLNPGEEAVRFSVKPGLAFLQVTSRD